MARTIGLDRLARAFWLSPLAPRAPEPFSYGYHVRRKAVIDRVLERMDRLPPERRASNWIQEAQREWMRARPWTAALDERLVEIPWVCSHLRSDHRLLDVGCVLNRPHILRKIRSRCRELHFLNIFEEPIHWDGPGVFFHHEDVRALSMPDGGFDRVSCISTLEHVGMDNAHYAQRGGFSGPSAERSAADNGPDRAIREMLRVTDTHGVVLITLPFGRDPHRPSLKVYGYSDRLHVLDILASLPVTLEETFFRLSGNLWTVSTPADCRDAVYGHPFAAASAVWCLSIRKRP